MVVFSGEMWPFLKGELDTIPLREEGDISLPSGDARGGLELFVGEERGGRDGGTSSWGEADLTVFTEAVEERESLEDVTDSLDGDMGDLFVLKSSVELDSLPLILLAMVRTGGLWVTKLKVDPSSS